MTQVIFKDGDNRIIKTAKHGPLFQVWVGKRKVGATLTEAKAHGLLNKFADQGWADLKKDRG